MNRHIVSESFKPPQHVDEVEALLGTTFFTNELEYEPEHMTGEELGFKTFIYRSCCRILAKARAEDRLAVPRNSNFDPRSWNDRWPTTRRIAMVAMHNEHDVSFLSRQLDLINHAKQALEDRWDEITGQLYPDQKLYILDIVTALQKKSKQVAYSDKRGQPQQAEVFGVTAVADTGYGKSYLIKACAELFAGQTAQRRIVLVAPSLIIQNQLAGMLKEAMSDIKVGKMSGDEHEPGADIVIPTIEMYNKHFRGNSIAGYPVDVTMIDEVHNLLEPEFQRTFLTHWRGLTIGFTATPAYDIHRDVRKVIPHVVDEHSNMEALIDQKRLNDRQIFSFIIDEEIYETLLKRYNVSPTEAETKAIIREVIDSLVIEFITPLLAEGRRGMIFCEAGNKAKYAEQLAKRITNEISLEDGRQLVAEAMHSYAANQDDIRERFLKGEIDVITTVDTGREGLDAPIDFVIINCNIISRLRGHQIVGRGTRYSKRFPVTIYGQFSHNLLLGRSFENLFCIEEAFGNSNIRQGGTSRDRRGQRQGKPPEPAEGTVDISKFSDLIQAILARVDRRPVGELFQGVNRGAWRVTENMKPLRSMLKDYTLNEAHAIKVLHRAGFTWGGKYETVDGKSRLIRYYPVEAEAYIEEHFHKKDMLTREEAAEHFGVPVSVINYVINNPVNNIQGRTVIRGKGKPPVCYDKPELAKMKAALKKIPGTQPGDSTVPTVAKLLGISGETVMREAGVIGKERYLISGTFPLTAAEAKAVEAAYGLPLAEPGELHITAIADKAGVDYQVVKRNMSEADYKQGTQKLYKDTRGYTQRGTVWPREKSNQLVEKMKRFQARELPAYLLPSSNLKKFVRNYGVISSQQITEYLEEAGFKHEEMIITKTRGMSRCLSWKAIAHLRRAMGKPKGKNAIEIDFNRLPTGPDDLDPEKIAYAQEFQRQFLKPEQLRKYS